MIRGEQDWSQIGMIFQQFIIELGIANLFQREPECGSLVHCAFCPDASVVPVDDARDCRQSDARAFEILVAMQAIEGAEQFSGVDHIETSAIVLYTPGILFCIPSEGHSGMRQFRGKFDGIADKVLDSDARKPRVGVYAQPRLDVEGQIAILVLFFQIIRDGFCQLAHAEILADDLRACNTGKLKQCINELTHALHATAHAADIVASCIIDVAA